MWRFAIASLALLAWPLAAAESSASPCPFAGLIDYVISGPPPQVHSGHYLSPPSRVGQRVAFSTKPDAIRPTMYFGIPGEHWLSVIEMKDGVLTAQDPFNRRYFRVSETPTGTELVEIEPPESAVQRQRQAEARSVPRGFRPPGDRQQLARALAESQARASDTVAGNLGRGVDNLVAANDLIAELFLQNRPIELADVEAVNLRITAGKDPQAVFTWPEHVLPFGIIRGTEPRVIERNVVYPRGSQGGKVDTISRFRVDMTQTQMTNESPFFQYLPASDVPGAMKEWLAAANAVGPHTSLYEVAKLHQQFIAIHPFADGNGRTARAFLDLMMMKAGFGPVPHSRRLTRPALYVDLPELAENLAQAYLESR